MDASSRQQSVKDKMMELGKEDYAATDIKGWESGVNPTMDISPIPMKASPTKIIDAVVPAVSASLSNVTPVVAEVGKTVTQEATKGFGQALGEAAATSLISSTLGEGAKEAFRDKKKPRKDVEVGFGGQQIGSGSSKIV